MHCYHNLHFTDYFLGEHELGGSPSAFYSQLLQNRNFEITGAGLWARYLPVTQPTVSKH